jgi:hypothetical protein
MSTRTNINNVADRLQDLTGHPWDVVTVHEGGHFVLCMNPNHKPHLRTKWDCCPFIFKASTGEGQTSRGMPPKTQLTLSAWIGNTPIANHTVTGRFDSEIQEALLDVLKRAWHYLRDTAQVAQEVFDNAWSKLNPGEEADRQLNDLLGDSPD